MLHSLPMHMQVPTMTSKSLKRARAKAQKQAVETAITKAVRKPHRKDWTKSISEHLLRSQWQLALDSLKSMREAKQVPKLGAVQRWVRLADLTGKESLAATLLDSIMRTATGRPEGTAAATAAVAGEEEEGAGPSPSVDGSIRRHPAWCPPAAAAVDPEPVRQAAEAAVGR
jgi:hypothetical protein